MRNMELIAKIYDRLPKSQAFKDYTIDQLFDRFMDIKDMIEAERPEIAGTISGKTKTTFGVVDTWERNHS